MSVRKIEYTLTAEGISPATVQAGGVQGDHRATELRFILAYKLFLDLRTLAGNDGRLVYRIDGYNGEGGIHKSEVFELTSSEISYMLEQWLTRNGGMVKVVLVISLVKNEQTEMELYSFPATLQLKSLPYGADVSGENVESMSTLAAVVKFNSEKATESAEMAVEAMERTENARAVLENGSEWIFDGGDVENEADIVFLVDGEVSDTSGNAIQNKVIKAYVDNLVKISLEAAIKQAKIDAKLEAHPVGSLYFSSDAIEPSVLFGGTWQRVKDKFILAAGDDYEAGAEGGEAAVALTNEEMPSHAHFVRGNVLSSAEGYAGSFINAPNQNDSSVQKRYFVDSTYTGGNMPHNNMPPYKVYYCWQRTA